MTAIAERQGADTPAAHGKGTAPIDPDEPAAYVAAWQVACDQQRKGLLTTAGLSIAEHALRVAQPLVLGIAINGLLSGSFVGLLIVFAQQLGQTLAATGRHMSASRLAANTGQPGFAAAAVGDSYAPGLPSRGGDAASLFAKITPTSLRTVFSILGALALLAWYDPMLAAMCGLMMIPAFLLGVSFTRKLAELDGNQDHGDAAETTATFELASSWERSPRPAWQVRYADAQAVHVGLIRLFTLGALALVLVHAATNRSLPAGDLFAIVCYTLMFMSGLGELPQLLRQWRGQSRPREK
ncbi:MAG: hypothetical protein ACF8TS_19345 [Maioricimonas sp. JB049]